jgi:flagella basal body P-ring formation protein FlgA
MLKSLVAADLGRRGLVADGATARTRFDRSLGALNADSRDKPASLVELNYASSSGQFAARFRIAGRTAPLDMTGRVDFMVEVPHLIGSQPAGKILTPSDVEMRPVPVGFADNGSFASLDQVVGKQLRHPARDGLMLRPADVADPLVVARNDTVTLYLKSGPMTLSVRGQALNDAAVGQKVSVLNLMSSKVVNGIAVATGAVEIGGHSATIANL